MANEAGQPQRAAENAAFNAWDARDHRLAAERNIAAWEAMWAEADFSWEGLADAGWELGDAAGPAQQLKRWRAPMRFPTDAPTRGSRDDVYRCASLQDYLRLAGSAAEDDLRLLTDEELISAGLLTKRGDALWHVLHDPEVRLDAENGGAGAALRAWLTRRLEDATSTDVKDAGPDGRVKLVGARAQGLDAVWRAFGGHEDPAQRRLLHVDASLARLSEFHGEDLEFGDEADFARAQFVGAAGFGGATFHGESHFTQAHFCGEADFRGTCFEGLTFLNQVLFEDMARFYQSHFLGEVSCNQALFRGEARFFDARFQGLAHLYQARFQDLAGFNRSQFLGLEASFRQAQFESGADFHQARFQGQANFSNARFLADAKLSEVQFQGEAHFSETEFSGSASFEGAAFEGDEARFGQARFADVARFHLARFDGAAGFGQAKFLGEAEFSSVVFGGLAEFRQARFERPARFAESEFKNVASMIEAQFLSEADFSLSTFAATTRFDQALFAGPAAFRQVQFRGLAYFYAADFAARASFFNARFGDYVNFRTATFREFADFQFALWPLDAAHQHAAFKGARLHDVGQFETEAFCAFALFEGADFRRTVLLQDPQRPDSHDKRFAAARRATQRAIEHDRELQEAEDYDARNDAHRAERGADARWRALAGGLRALKQVGKAQGNHDQEQTYYRYELKARAGQPSVPAWEKFASACYGLASDYGASIARPFAAMFLVITPVMALFYWVVSLTVQASAADSESIIGAFTFSLKNAVVPFSAWRLGADADATEWLRTFKAAAERSGVWLGVLVLASIQSLCTLLLAFLFALAVRRRFQIT